MEIILNKQNILYLLLLVMSSALAYLLFSDSETYVSEYKEKIELLQHQVDSIYLLNEKLDLEVKDLHIQIVQKDERIDSINKEINEIRNETKAKVNAADALSNVQLDSVISNRYRQSTNQ